MVVSKEQGWWIKGQGDQAPFLIAVPIVVEPTLLTTSTRLGASGCCSGFGHSFAAMRCTGRC